MTITLIAASFIGLLLLYLSYMVSKNRLRAKVSVGDGGDEQLQSAIRAQGNLVEYAPTSLILLALLEYQGANHWLLITLAVFLVVGRYMHGLTFGKFEGKNPYRFYGTLFTWIVILIACVSGILYGYHIL